MAQKKKLFDLHHEAIIQIHLNDVFLNIVICVSYKKKKKIVHSEPPNNKS